MQKPALSRKVWEEDLCLHIIGEQILLELCPSDDLKGAFWLILAIKVAFSRLVCSLRARSPRPGKSGRDLKDTGTGIWPFLVCFHIF